MTPTANGVPPLFVELCAGTAAVSLALQGGPNARPPVSRMGSKRGYVSPILGVLGLRQGQGAGAYLWCEPDDGARLMLQAYPQPALLCAAAEIIRGWSGEEPRALWERLRKEGPIGSGAYEVARWACIVGGNRLVNPDPQTWRNTGHGGYIHGGEAFATEPGKVADGLEALAVSAWGVAGGLSYRQGYPDSGYCEAGANGGRMGDVRDRVGARLEALAIASQVTAAGLSWACDPANGFKAKGGGGEGQGPPHVSLMKDRVSSLVGGWPPVTVCSDCREIDPRSLPEGTVAYIDPPYQGTTGYAHNLHRAEALSLATRWADAGHTVCVSEAESLADDLEGEWHAVEITHCRKGQKRTFSKQKREWLTLNRAPAWVPMGEQTGLWDGIERTLDRPTTKSAAHSQRLRESQGEHHE